MNLNSPVILLMLSLLSIPSIATHSPPSVDSVPFPTRLHWMRVASSANLALSPCPFAPFGAAIVNHTPPSSAGDLICTGLNHNGLTGNPSLHGEMAALANCSEILTSPRHAGGFGLSAAEALESYKHFTLYTTGEPCPMCASAIRWAGFKEMVFGTSITTLVDFGWSQIGIESKEVFERSEGLGTETRWIGSVGANETDGLFGWQFRDGGRCPTGCERRKGEGCAPAEEVRGREEL